MKNSTFAMLLCVVMMMGLFIACEGPMTSISNEQPEIGRIPEGLGQAVLELPTSISARTAGPDTVTIKEYLVRLIPSSDASLAPVNKRYNPGQTIRENIGSGKWSGMIYAFGTDSIHPIAQSEEISFELKEGETKYIPVLLNWNPAATLQGNGILNTRLSFPGELRMADITTARLIISRVEETDVLSDIMLAEGDNPLNLAAGAYIAKVSITDRWGRTGYYTEACIVIPGETTRWGISSTNREQEGEYGTPILVISVNPVQPPTLITPVMEAIRGVTVVFRVAGSAETVKWYVDGVLQNNASDSTEFALSTSNRTPGMNQIMVVVTNQNGLTSSSSTRLNIIPGQNQEYVVHNEAELKAAATTIASSAATTARIIIAADFTLNPLEIGWAGGTITMDGGTGHILTLASQGSIFKLTVGSNLVIRNLTLRGIPTNNQPLVCLDNAYLVLEDGVTLEGNTYTLTEDGPKGGAIYAASSHIKIRGALIRDNHIVSRATMIDRASGLGAGIYLMDSMLDFYSGSIESNTIDARNTTTGAGANGGGVAAYGASIISMYGGTIRGNLLRSISSWWDMAQGGGVFVAGQSLFVMTGGVINGNRAESSAPWTMTGPWFGQEFFHELGASGGGVCTQQWDGLATLKKTGGIVYGYEAVGYDEDGYPLANQAVNGKGQAVYTGALDTLMKKHVRNSTADSYIFLDSEVHGINGGWEE